LSAEAERGVLDGLVQEYLDHLTATRSAHTVRSYGVDLSQLAQHLGGRFELTPESLRGYLRKYGSSSVTRARKLSSLRSFVKYLRKVGKLALDPTESLEAPIRRRNLPKTLSQQQAVELLDQESVGKTPRRDRALLELAYSAGLRASELVGTNIGDIDFVAKAIRSAWLCSERPVQGL